MFNNKKMRQKDEKISALKRRIYELEELICPLNQHEYVEIDHAILTDCVAGQIESYCVRKLQCRKCRRVVDDSDRITGFKYKTVDEK